MRVIDEAWKRAGVPSRHVGASPDPTGHWGIAYRNLSQQLGSGMLSALIGERGTGKTQLAVELIRQHIADNRRPFARYTRAVAVFMRLREAFRSDDTTEAQTVAEFTRPRLLVIDEAHERGGTEWENRLLTHIIDVRYSDMRDTILVSNETPGGFKAAVGSSIYSRLIETGGIIVCDWPSFRGVTP